MREVNMVIAISMTGSSPGIFTPLSSDDRSFFIQSSGLCAVSVTSPCEARIANLILSGDVLAVVESLQLDVSLLERFQQDMQLGLYPVPCHPQRCFYTPKCRCSPVVLVPVFQSRLIADRHYIIASLDGNAAQVHVGTLILAAVISVVFYQSQTGPPAVFGLLLT